MSKLSQHFHEDELRCRGRNCGPDGGPCGLAIVSPRLVMALETLRLLAGAPVLINSGYRCKIHNAAVGGSPNSQHLRGTAADVRISGLTPRQVAEMAEQVPAFHAGGIGIYRTFVHLDVRTGGRARWTM